MASRSSSRSEGEVLSSDSEAKANKTPSFKSNSKVDRQNRPYPAPRSPAYRSHRSRSRSRSPYRAPRGEKRRRDDDPHPPRHDPRTFNVRYEDDQSSHRRSQSYDHRDSKRSRTYSKSRSRSRSRSPYRHSRQRDADHAKDVENRQDRRKADNITSKSLASRPGEKDMGTRLLKPHTESRSRLGPSPIANKSKVVAQAAVTGLVNNIEDVKPESHPTSSTEDKSITQDDVGPQVLDEAALIEQRRKRREAIKNKYRGQATPLLVQALHLGGESGPTTPGPALSSDSPARSVSPTTSAPETPRDSAPQSPAAESPDVVNGLADSDHGSPAEEEPSAADYDPTVDMEAERARHDRRLFKEDDTSLANAEKQVLDNTSASVPAVMSEKNDFDMFADDNDDNDDMFAEIPTKPKSEAKAAQALDVTMMDNWDDPDGYYITILGELIENRYHVTQTLGRGMFSSVVRAKDSTTNIDVAIKIVRNNESMRKAGLKEIDILKDITANDPEDKKHVIRLLRSFDHKGHLCMVFENLSLNLREVLKKFGRDIGISLKAIRAYSQQLFLGLSLLRKCQYLHADLKPDNILVNDARNLIKICDLGSASPVTENATAPYLVSRFYRAPEVILGIPYDYGIDMWSIGCTLFELFTGKILFTGRNNNNMLRAIMECCGKFPHKLLRRGSLTYDYFDDLLNFRAMETDKVTGRPVTKLIDIKAKPVKDLRSRLLPKDKRIDEQERRDIESFADLLDKCLDLRPDKRITPTDALKHPFIMRTKP